MTIELIVVETLERKLADVPVPRVDVDAVRRDGRGRRLARIGSSAAAVLATLGAVTALVIGGTAEPDRAVDPVALPVMDFSPGLRGYYDPSSGSTHLAGQAFELESALDPAASAAPTRFGLVFFEPDQSVRLLPADGRVRTLAAAPIRANAFTPTVKYDPSVGMIAWLTRSDGEVVLSVYEFSAQLRLIGTYPVHCARTACESVRVAGIDQGVVFIHDDSGSRVIDPGAGPEARWEPVSDGQVVDARNRVILVHGDESTPLPAALVADGWRKATAESADSLLTFDGDFELAQSATLTSTAGADARASGIPPGDGPVDFSVDTDGSVLAARTIDGAHVIWDCAAAISCIEIARMPDTGVPPVFLGRDS